MPHATGRALHRLRVLLIDNPTLLIAGAVGGLAWANISPAHYAAFAHQAHFVVNDIAMVFFFGLATKEVFEATLPGGPLAIRRQAAVPVVATLGGMIGPIAIYVGLSIAFDVPQYLPGWAIPCATDIAFSYLLARIVFGPQHPAIPFLLLLAIADDALGLVILAIFYPTGELHLLEFVALVGAAMALAWFLKQRKVKMFWPYVIIAGALSWYGLYRGGLHPALALVPIVPFIPHARTDLGILDEREPSRPDPLSAFERAWRAPVQVILFLFGLVNAGVPLSSVGTGTTLVMTALVVGKPLGIIGFTAAAVGLGGRRPNGVSWHDIVLLGTCAGIGFTVALFFATASFPRGQLLDETKMGALLSLSVIAIALPMAFFLGCGRFEKKAADDADNTDGARR